MTVRDVRGFCTLCRSRCGAIFTTDGEHVLRVAPDPDHPTGGALCAKGRAAPEILADPDRLTVPMRRTRPKSDPDPGWAPVSWDEALDDIAARLIEIRDADGAKAVAFATTTPSGSGIGDSIEWIEAFVRQFGSPNLAAAVEVCSFQKDYGHAFTFGKPLGTPDYAHADTIVLWGHNPARTWLAQASAIAARKPGARLVVIDPQRAGSGNDADLWLRVRPSTDAALALGGINFLLAGGHYDAAFLRAFSDAPMLVDLATGRKLRATDLELAEDGFVAMGPSGPVVLDAKGPRGDGSDLALYFRGEIIGVGECATAFTLLAESAKPWDIAAVAAACALAPDDITTFYRLLAEPQRIAFFHWSGLSQSDDSTQAVRAISALFALRGDVDCEGTNRWLAAPALTPFERPASLPAAIGAEALPLGPPRHGFVTVRDLCDAIERVEPYPVRALVSFGANLLASQPDPARLTRAFRQLDFQVHIDVRHNPAAASADYLLPATLPWEHSALRAGFEISEAAVAHVQLRPAVVRPPADQRPDYEIVRSLAQRIGLTDPLWYGSISEAWDRRLAPTGLDCATLLASPGGVSLELPQSTRNHAHQADDGRMRGFATPSGRVELHSEQLGDSGVPAIPTWQPAALDVDYPLTLISAKQGVFTHSSYRAIPSLVRRAPEPMVGVSPATAARHGIVTGDWCTIGTIAGEVTMRARIDEDIANDVLVADFGWWEQHTSDGAVPPLWGAGSTNFNSVIDPDRRDPVSGSPPLRRMPARLAKDIARSRGHWAGERSFTIAARRDHPGGIAELTLTPTYGGAVPSFHPGQHVAVTRADGAVTRYYSLTSPADAPAAALSIAVRRVDEGQMSTFLHDVLEPGDPLHLRAPSGLFRIPIATRRPLLLLAGGVGITPFLGFGRTLARLSGQRPDVTLLSAARSIAEAAFDAELRALDVWKYRLLLSRLGEEPLPPHARPIRIEAALAAMPIPPDLRVFMCGPTGFMDAARAQLIARGVPSHAIEQEAFVMPALPTGDLVDATVTLSRSGISFGWSRSQGSILAAATAAGIPLPNGCRVGQCESCALTLLHGNIVQPQSLAEPDACLTCCAMPNGDIVLDG